ncbi:hypothetical protein QF037_009171 [Streptomyces canus]|uniref:hypothetical protein n=1 Tax=Streptomyces canus TaxID=58343 RepID=UPI002783DCAA|nr:hypothetical protein [Streptomyces canus]MDQ0604826.1 hypothetical protein [Streptomyces canus]
MGVQPSESVLQDGLSHSSAVAAEVRAIAESWTAVQVTGRITVLERPLWRAACRSASRSPRAHG